MYASAIDILKRCAEEAELEASCWDNDNRPDDADLSRKVADACKLVAEYMTAR